MPKLTYFRNGYNGGFYNQINSFFVYDRSYLRLKTIQVGYNFPQKWLGNIFIENARIYINGKNLFTWTDYPLFDPERAEKTFRTADSFPQSKIISFGATITF